MKYKITYQKNLKLHTIKIECENLNSVTLPKNIIKIEKQSIKFFPKKKIFISIKQIYYFFYELNMMLQANINIRQSLDILYKTKKLNTKLFCKELISCVKSGKGLNINRNNFNIDNTIYNFFTMVNKKGNIKLSIEALVSLLKFNIDMKNQLIKSFSYPIILLITLFISLFCIFYFVLPSFETLISNNAIKPNIGTILIFDTKYFLEKYIALMVFLLFTFFICIYIFYKKYKKFQFLIHKFLATKIYFISSYLKYFELYKFFMVLNILQKANYEFYDALCSSNSLMKNKYILDKISLIGILLKSGENIGFAFEKSNIFDDLVLNLIQTGEKSNNMSLVTFEIEKIYKQKYKNKIKLLCFWIQPFVFSLIMGMILWLIYAVFVPMWSMSDMIKY